MADVTGATVAVTGARGLVGEAVVRQLGDAGFAMRRLSRFPLRDGESDTAVLPPFDAPDRAFEEALAGATHVVHAAALTNVSAKTTEAEFMNTNARLTQRLAEAGSRVTDGRFILISSIRAVAGKGAPGILDASRAPAPSSVYGRSKLAGEAAAADAFSGSAHRLCILRPAPIYGRAMRGNLGRLLQLARMPYPLPFGGLKNRRSLLDVEALARAVVHVLTARTPVAGAYIVSDKEPVTVAEIVTAFRTGMGRSPNLFSMPPALLQAAASLAGQGQALRGIFTEEICDPSALEDTGWTATENSIGGLAALADPQWDGARP